MKFTIFENSKIKALKSKNYNYIFNKETGYFIRFGKTKEEDPEYGLPEIADIEITEKCNGVADENGIRVPCKFCYKSNCPNKGKIMDFETFKRIFEKLPKSITQIAFGVDAQGITNPDMIKIMEYTRSKGVIPNITIADITKEMAEKLARVCGAVAVSYYPQRDKNRCYNSVKFLTDAGLKQVNIHCMISKETFRDSLELIEDVKNDKRLKNLNCIVFLSLKQKGRGKTFNPLNEIDFKQLIDKLIKKEVNYGFDSCTAFKYLKIVSKYYLKIYKEIKDYIEPCESTLFSMYLNTEGKFYPCSFIEGENISQTQNWKDGIDILKTNDFLKEVWYNEKVIEFRKMVINCRNCQKSCPFYNI